MKRTHSGELPSDPSQINLFTNPPAGQNQEQQQQDNGANNGAPVIRAPAANGGRPTLHNRDPAINNPPPELHEDAEIPGWQNFGSWNAFLPPLMNTPPNVTRANAPQDEVTGDSIVIKPDGRTSTRHLIESYPRNPSLTNVTIRGCNNTRARTDFFPTRTLSNFFEQSSTIRRFSIEFLSAMGLNIDPQLLSSIFRNSSLNEFELSETNIGTHTSEQIKSLTEILRKNTSLKVLKFYEVKFANTLPAILEGIAGNSSIETLELGHSLTPGCGKWLADMLRSNQTIKKLVFTVGDSRHFSEVESGMIALQENKTLEILEFKSNASIRLQGDHPLIKSIMANQTLKTLRLPNLLEPSQETEEAMAQLVRGHPQLSSIHFGYPPNSPKPLMTLAEAIKSNQRLNQIGINWLLYAPHQIKRQSQLQDIENFLSVAGRSPSLNSVTFDCFDYIDCLIDFLNAHPQIRKIGVTNASLGNMNFLEKLLSFVKSSSQITDIAFPDKSSGHHQVSYYAATREALEKALEKAAELNRELTSEINITIAGIGLSGALRIARSLPASTAKALDHDGIPELPSDVTIEIAKAISRHLKPADAKTIFDVFTPFARMG